MSTVGPNCARIYVMQKELRKEMKRKEEERLRKGETANVDVEENKTGGGKNKVHPGNCAPPAGQDTAGKDKDGSEAA
ncbi:hypothetical protein SLEP1_g23334 [Rubroshorea leprosula]|uniref:Uncharacterized protein n=1 Tax=Rubroshorea leprosula TaxID=152421 RepID=A0AAV5JI54_9ROSI|nr:hypothetical protein SLEP1_g23334 [Rubroshorea leprosula]